MDTLSYDVIIKPLYMPYSGGLEFYEYCHPETYALKNIYRSFFYPYCGVGTACHFAFDFFGQSRLIAPFVPVNESTWEHLKLLFFPFLLLLVIGCFAGIAGGKCTYFQTCQS